jgi:hypothetical protein
MRSSAAPSESVVSTRLTGRPPDPSVSSTRNPAGGGGSTGGGASGPIIARTAAAASAAAPDRAVDVDRWTLSPTCADQCQPSPTRQTTAAASAAGCA